VRDGIVKKAPQWRKVRQSRIAIEGDVLKRPPAGYAADHAFVDDLKRKDYYTMTSFTEKEVCAPGFLDRYADACETAAPLVAFLTRSLGLRW
jgi:uncharacterized protein (DUF2461 family)